MSFSVPNAHLSAAFGDEAGTDLSALDFPDCPRDRWLHAIALAAQGRHAVARVVVAPLLRLSAHGDQSWLRPAGLALLGSMWRQRGFHTVAARLDGGAVAALEDIAPAHRSQYWSATRIDAFTGLAADALGQLRFALAADLLGRACPASSDDPASSDEWWAVPRARLRWTWVRTELAIYSGDGDGALAAIAASHVPDGHLRHTIKTKLIAAAALASTGEIEAAASAAARATDLARISGQTPLEWAGIKLSAALAGDATERVTSERRAHILGAHLATGGADLAQPTAVAEL